MATKPLWRQEIELLQNYGKHKAFTYTTSSGSAENALVLAADLAKNPDQRQFKDYFAWQTYLLGNGSINLKEKKQNKTYGPSSSVDQ